ncbi:MAG: hypothetical protein IK130_08300, partial [Oscillospiraceae bacterium]|nr:hypothetical protein [Oscillospiraceae bacterium]
MKMNMQDYRHAQDRVHIAEHCKEEVLSMAQNQKTNGRPIIRIAAGITAAAACLAVVGTLGHSFFNGKQDGILMPATTSDISAQFEEQGAKSAVTTPAAAKPETDDREFPLLSSMSEDKRTKTFKWGTIKLNSFLVSNFGENDKDAEYIEFQFDVHLNDDIDITEADAFNVEWYCSMYDTAMEHKITQFNPTTLHLQGFDDTHNFRISCDCFIPEEAAACLTKDETGEYREIYSDFLEKQPIPDYLLYELEITDAEIEAVHYDGGNEIKEVLVSEKTPMFKFRPADAPKDEAEIVNIKPGDALGEAADIEEDSTEAVTTTAVSETTAVSSENRNASDSEKLDAANKAAEQFYAAVQAAIADMKADETLSPYDLENMEKGFEFNEFEISEIRSASKENNPFYYYIAQHLPAQTAFITVAFGVESEKCKYVIVQTADIISS